MRHEIHEIKNALALGLAVTLGAVWGQAMPSPEVRGSFERALTVSGPVNLEITTGSGDITVRPGVSGTVEIRGKIHVEEHGISSGGAEAKVHEIEANPPIEQVGNQILIGRRGDHEFQRGIAIDYEVTAPPQTQVKSRTGSGDVTVEGIHGPVEAESGSGDIKLSSIRDDVTVQTGSGDAKFEGIEAHHVNIETGSGDVELREMHCALRAETGSGDIQVEGQPTGRWQLHTGSGEVSLRLPPDLGFDLDAHTESGDIHTHFKITMEGTLEKGELRGKVRGGGVPVEVRTGSGDIQID
jgi:DUF4097 and DUF4098 domain-containing protein YvlB